MTMLGMDVDLVSNVATQLDQRATALQSLTTEVDRLVASTASEWFGADARAFVQEWQAQHRPALVNAATALAAQSADARRNVAEQVQASGGTPGTTPGTSTTACTITPDGKLASCVQSVTAGHAPADTSSLLSLVNGAYSQPGGVSVTFTGTGADRHAIVAISGTKQWNFGGTDPDDMSTNIENAYGVNGLKQEAIAQAMASAGVTSTDKVLLVGHSQGGADAINFASNPVFAGKYNIAGVVTAGAPETIHYPAASVPVLELRTSGDLVPMAGAASAQGMEVAGLPGAIIGHAVHDATMPSNVKVVELPGGYELPQNAHKIANYVTESQHVSDPAVGDFMSSHADFLNGAPSTTFTYSAQRVGGGIERYE